MILFYITLSFRPSFLKEPHGRKKLLKLKEEIIQTDGPEDQWTPQELKKYYTRKILYLGKPTGFYL